MSGAKMEITRYSRNLSLSAVEVFVLSIEGTVHAKIPSTFIHPHVVQNRYDFLLLNTQENTLKNTGVQR